jgi:hypothetical protein
MKRIATRQDNLKSGLKYEDGRRAGTAPIIQDELEPEEITAQALTNIVGNLAALSAHTAALASTVKNKPEDTTVPENIKALTAVVNMLVEQHKNTVDLLTAQSSVNTKLIKYISENANQGYEFVPERDNRGVTTKWKVKKVNGGVVQ